MRFAFNWSQIEGIQVVEVFDAAIAYLAEENRSEDVAFFTKQRDYILDRLIKEEAKDVAKADS